MTGLNRDEQRHLYKGIPLSPWIRVAFDRADGHGVRSRDLAIDTGDPRAVRIGSNDLRLFRFADGPFIRTNFGPAFGGWVRLTIPDIGLDRWVLAFATDALVTAVRGLHPDFAGQAGMELLREVEYGGNDREFWVRSLSSQRR